MKLLICDPIDEAARTYFKDNGIDFVYQPDIDASQLRDSVSRFDGLLVRSRTKVTKELLENGTYLKIIGRIGSGYDNIDIEECRKRKITVVNSPDANSIAVAELTVGLTISFLRQIPRAYVSMQKGEWIKKDIWGTEISGKTVGILGYGYVGSKVDRLFTALGAKTIVYSNRYKTVNIKDLFSRADIVSIHVSLTSETKGMITKDLLLRMKPSAILVNIARGSVINEEDLYEVLYEKKIRGAILDVYWQEPLPPDSRWRKLQNVLLTPHIGAATSEALGKASLFVAQDVVRFSKGERLESRVV